MTLRLGQEISGVEQFIYDRLIAVSAITDVVGDNIHGYQSPQHKAYPAIVWQLQAPSEDVKAIGNIRIMVRPIYVVRVVDQVTSWASLKPVADAIDAALEGATGVGDDYEVLVSYRMGPFGLVETVNALQYRHLGGSYRFAVQLTT